MKVDAATLVMVHRYLYYVLHTPVISDYEYDLLERRATAKASAIMAERLRKPGSEDPRDYTKQEEDLAARMIDGETFDEA